MTAAPLFTFSHNGFSGMELTVAANDDSLAKTFFDRISEKASERR